MKKSIRLRARAFAPALSVLSLACASAWAQAIENVTVTSTRVEFSEIDAPYAVEVHTKKDIQNSGTTTLYDYLSKFSGLQVGSGFGNKDAPLIGMRGFGLENGFENMAVVLNGQKINSIDQGPPLLSAIAIQDIERIEISRGVGSTLFGEGATAGVMEITTKPLDGARMQAYTGSFGAQGLTLQAGKKMEAIELDFTADERRLGGFVAPDADGQKDGSKTSNWKAGLGWQDASGLKIRASAARSDVDTRYNNYLSFTNWSRNPYLNQGISKQKYVQDNLGFAVTIPLDTTRQISLQHQNSKRFSGLTPWYDPTSPTEYDYKQTTNEVVLSDRISNWSWRLGGLLNQAERSNKLGVVHKDTDAVFAQTHVRLDSMTWMLGARQERVSYSYAQPGNSSLSSAHNLPQWETGFNKSLGEISSIFATYSKSFLAPDVDRFYKPVYNGSYQVIGQEFNSFIVPAKVSTYTLGYNQKTHQNLFKISVFRADLQNEIYVTPDLDNTNLEKTHKYGFEVQDKWKISPALSARVNYTYTVAKIDTADATRSNFNGKNLPGVSRDMVMVGLSWKPGQKHTLNVSQAWRSEAYAFQDFENKFVHKMPSYRSTDLSYDFAYSNATQIYMTINNLFDKNNAIVVNDRGFYAVDFARTWSLGIRTSL